MKTKIISAIAALFFLAGAVSGALAGISVPGADAIPLGEYFEAQALMDGAAAGETFEIVSGSLPHGLRLTSRNKIEGYPAGIERTTARLRANKADGSFAESDVAFAVVSADFRLIYRELPVAKLGETVKVRLEGQGGQIPYGDCRVVRARTYFEGAAKPGMKAPAEDAAPAWLSVSPACELTAAPDKEAVVLLIVEASDASGATASEFYALRSSADPSAPGWMESKAREYNKDYQDRFSPYGLTLEIDPKGAYQHYGDSAIWTGTYLAGAAYFYAVTGEDYARANMLKSLDATTRLREITGVPGLIGRAYENDEWIGHRDEPYIKPDPSRFQFEITDGPYKGWRFLSTASRDQFTGVYWGNATVFDLFDEPEFRRKASENIVSMSSHIWDNRMRIQDVDGKHTRHGIMSGYGIQGSEGGDLTYDPYTSPARMANGFNAALILNWFNMAATVAQDDDTRKLWRQRYINLISKDPNPEPERSFERNYLSILKKVYVYGEAYNDYWDTLWFNLNLLHNNYFHLARFERHPKIRERYRETLQWLWKDKVKLEDGCQAPEKRRTEHEGNPHFTWQYLGAMGDRDASAVFNAVDTLMAFPRGPRAPYIPAEPVEFKTVPGHDDWTCEPVPIQYRRPQDFQWQRSPYDPHLSYPEHDHGRNFAGVDMITPYWMGRYFGYIPSYL